MADNYSFKSNLFFINSKISLDTKKKYKYIIVIIFLTSFFEIINIGSVVPLIAILTNPDQINNFGIFKNFSEFFGAQNVNIKDYKFFIFLFFLITIISANALRLLLFTYSLKVAQSVSLDVAGEVFKSSICKNYSDINMDKSEDVISIIIQKIESFGSLVFQIISFVSSFLIILFYFILLLF